MFTFKEPMDRKNNYSLSEIALKSGFKFRDIENRKLDWRTLGCVDVNKVIEKQDYEFLEKITPKIIEAPMQSILGTAAIDPAVSSLFRLSQMCLQYLSFCQQFMSHTLYDLRIAFNQLQRKHSNLKHDFQGLEMQHYKAQEQIQFLLNETKTKRNPNEDNRIGNQLKNSKPTSLFPCDACTKNFLSLDLLKSHQQRKHSIIEEKHELSDDNEKTNDDDRNLEDVGVNDSEPTEFSAQSKPTECFEQKTPSQPNNNNDSNDSNANCAACSTKATINSSSIAIQCEVDSVSVEQNQREENVQQNNMQSDANKCRADDTFSEENARYLNNELVQSAYETINELKKEILDLKKSFEMKNSNEPHENVSEPIVSAKDTNVMETSEKIDVIEQKFNAFETMYMESQHHFIESFRNLDERQKVYMNNIQETIKDIVEKSFRTHPTMVEDNIESENIRKIEIENVSEVTDNKMTIEDSHDPNRADEEISTIAPNTSKQPTISESSRDDDNDDDQANIVWKVDVHSNNQIDIPAFSMESQIETKKKHYKQIPKDIVVGEFEQRLRQLGVGIESAGLTTPRSSEVIQDLAEEREEMKKAHKSFGPTRKKIKKEVDRIAREKLQSASSVTSLSSTAYQSDDQITDVISPVKRVRPKSASVQQMRKRNVKKLMQKYVENDIDENDIKDKMKIAQKAISAHRECIQELLQTTAHSPSSLTKVKYSSAKDETKRQELNEKTELDTNQYNKMPNITTRRVVFVNLDEDS